MCRWNAYKCENLKMVFQKYCTSGPSVHDLGESVANPFKGMSYGW